MIWLTEVIRDEEGNAIGLGEPLPDEKVIPMLDRMEYHLNEQSLGNGPHADVLYDSATSLYQELTIRRSQRIIILQNPQTVVE